MIKYCKICGKEFEGYYSRKYCSNRCEKIGDKAIKDKWKEKNREIDGKSKRKWIENNKNKNREIHREWYYRNKEKQKEYKKTDKYKKIHNISNDKWTKNNPEKKYAESQAKYRIKIPKGQLCKICNKNLARERHHPDYSKPLEVKFLCIKCHNKIHRKN